MVLGLFLLLFFFVSFLFQIWNRTEKSVGTEKKKCFVEKFVQKDFFGSIVVFVESFISLFYFSWKKD